MANKIKKMNVNDLLKLLNDLIENKEITGETEIWLSSDEEGNNYSPLITINGDANMGLEKDKSKLIFYPCHIRDDGF